MTLTKRIKFSAMTNCKTCNDEIILFFSLATVHCHSILRVQELDKAVAEIGEWEPLCENLGAPVPVVNQLRSDSIPPGSKKRQCLKGYIDLGTACWETVVQVVADHPFYNKKLAKKIADDNGIDYSTIVRDDL